MNVDYVLTIPILIFLALFQKSHAIYCYQCNSNEDTYCSEIFNLDDVNLDPSLCEGIYEVKYCIKTTGMYEGAIGTRRFCSSRHHGNYCEYVKRPGDDREYRSCVYTCSSDGCNGSSTISNSLSVTLLFILSSIAWIMLK